MVHMKKDKNTCSPFLKWAGGKSQLLGELSARFPKNLGTTITKYAEPFVGGGAVLFYILRNYKLDEIYISDINAELLNVYIQIRDNLETLIQHLQEIQDTYLPMETEARKEFYYEKRERYNQLKHDGVLDTEMATLFIFLNRTCFNGLYRVNSKGGFNVPMGAYKNPTICDADNLKAVSAVMQNVKVVCGSYEESESFIDDKTFVYFDPPYRPLSTTSSFTSYTEGDFNDEDQKKLADYCRKLNEKGAYILASNSDPKNTNPDDNFFDDLYSDFTIERVGAIRMINSKTQGRGQISELLIRNF